MLKAIHGPAYRITLFAVGLLAIVLALLFLKGDAIYTVLWPVLFVLTLAALAGPRKDEVEKHADKSAFYWGGSVGLLIAMISAQLLDAPGFWRQVSEYFQFTPDLDPEKEIFSMGAFHLAFCVGVSGYLWRLGWWIAKR